MSGDFMNYTLSQLREIEINAWIQGENAIAKRKKYMFIREKWSVLRFSPTDYHDPESLGIPALPFVNKIRLKMIEYLNETAQEEKQHSA